MMAAPFVTVILLAPLVAIIVCLLGRRPRLAEYVNLIAAVIVFVAVLCLLAESLAGPRRLLSAYIIVDSLGAWVLLCTACVYLLGSIYAVGYMRTLGEDQRLPRFYALYAGFALTMLIAPLMNNVGVYWISIELTTLVSTFLVCFELGRESIEAGWKYIVVVSAGITLALLGTVLYYWGGSLVIGPTYDMTWEALRKVAPHTNPIVATAAFLLVTIGFGTKVGLAPMHTWLPDAHSEGPTPVSVMLSGALLNSAVIGIVRYLHVSDAGHLGLLPRGVTVALGAFSLFVAALFIVRQTEIKRLMAYSSIEHMGIIMLGFGFGGVLGVAGALYHMLNHSLNKSLMFFGAGNAMRKWGTKDIDAIRNVPRHVPVSGWVWLAGAVAITGAPPFGLFLSELTILRAGMASRYSWAVYVMLVLLIVIFIGFLNHFRKLYFDDASVAPCDPILRAEVQENLERNTRFPTLWCTVPMWLSLIPILVLGLWWPEFFLRFFALIARSLNAGVGS